MVGRAARAAQVRGDLRSSARKTGDDGVPVAELALNERIALGAAVGDNQIGEVVAGA
jgi:hypothetical protein